MSAFRAYFKRRTGYDWPGIGDIAPPGLTWDQMMLDTVADYLDELTGFLVLDIDPPEHLGYHGPRTRDRK